MGSFKELGDLLRDAKGTIKEIQTTANDIKGQSIAKKSSAAILQFPVIMSRSINVDTASSVVKALERQYATFVQMVIALNPVIDWDKHKNVEDYVRTLHQNNPTPIDLIESCINVYSDEELGLRMIMSLNEGCSGQVLQANRQQLICVEDCLNQNKLNDLYKPAQITLERANASLDYFILSEAKHRPKKNNGKTTYKSLDEFGKAYQQMQQGKNPQPNAEGPHVSMQSGGGGVVDNPVANQQPSVNDSTVINGNATANTTKFNPKTYGANRNPYNKEIEDVFRQYGKHVKVDATNYKGGMLVGANSAENNPKLHEELRKVDSKYGRQYSKTLYQNNTTNNSGAIKPDYDAVVTTDDNGKVHISSKSADIKSKQDPKVDDPTVVNGKATANSPNKGNKNSNGPKERPREDVAAAQARANAENEKRKKEAEAAELKMHIEKDNQINRARTSVKLSDNDIKKCNELVPTTLSVSVQQIKGNNFGTMLNFVLGVKGVMHPVNSEEMVSNLLDGYKSGNKFFNFLRWTSGEISFFKDLLFNIDGIKEDVVKKHNKGSHWWTTLKRNRTLARTKNAIGNITKGKNRILPNATIVCSMEEVMEIQDVYGVDLMEVRNVLKLMDRYFLLGFVVVDESQELCYFIFDGERDYQALSFKGLERENNNKNDFKDIYKMINSGRL